MSAAARHCDVAIVGGGMVGASLALALAATRLDVMLIEAVEAGSDAQPSFDDRTTALGNGARRILDTLGVWQEIAECAGAIRRIHVSDSGHFGCARLEAAAHGLEAFGYTVSNRHIGAVLWRALRGAAQLELLSPARVLEVQLGEDAAQLRLVTAQGSVSTVSARLIVAADGAHSLVKQAANIDSSEQDYQQVALVANLRSDRAACGIAYERFAAGGPLALLPLADGGYTCVWTLEPQRARLMQECDPAQFCAQLQQAFGWRAGQFRRVGQRSAYRLSLVRAQQCIAARAALIGNAAQALHPIAAQGFNLGLRDAAVLAELIAPASDPGAAPLLEQFAERRAADRRGMIAFTDGLVKLFADQRAAVIGARNLGLLLFDVSAPAKRALSRLSFGFGGALPRLARGLPLAAPARSRD
ncbi:MAG: 2-octaprenyl-6-methoxyphenyl hydroxylase [Steroidobacteraceae bacterium]|jgi:2-octaprenyl-6-methoxyphenol hydroxylase